MSARSQWRSAWRCSAADAGGAVAGRAADARARDAVRPLTPATGPVSVSVAVAGSHDRDAIAAMLARAFAEDPAMSFIWPDPAVRAACLPRLFRLLFDADALAGVRLVTAGGAATALWRGPGQARIGTATMLRQAIPMLAAFGTALPRALALSRAIEAHFPDGAHWYLHIAGCDPAAQGRGLGKAAVSGGLDRIAGSGLPACLETATEANIGFYGALGFAVVGEWRVPNGGPLFWSMTRP